MSKQKVASLVPIYETLHCNTSFYSLQKITKCPTCGAENLEPITHESNIGPAQPKSVCIKPTFGSFYNYEEDSLLHCGISDSQGRVKNFDNTGVKEETWDCCLSVSLNSRLADKPFDDNLKIHFKQEQKDAVARPYRCMENNCYDFVIRFLNLVNWEGSSNHVKYAIVARLLGTVVDTFESYFTILLELQKQDMVAVKQNENNKTV